MEVGLFCTLPPYTIRRSGIFHFRIVVPQDIRSLLEVGEFRMSMRTGYVREARIKASQMASIALQAFEEVRKGKHGNMEGLTSEEIRLLVKDWLREVLEIDERARAERIRPRREEDVDDEIEALDIQRTILKEKLSCDDHRTAIAHAKDLIEDKNLGIKETDSDFSHLCREMVKAQIEALSVIVERNKGNYDAVYNIKENIPILSVQQKIVEPEQEAAKESPLMSDILNDFVREKVELKEWSERTKDDNEPIVRDFIQLVGDMPIGSLTSEHMRDARDRLKRIPKNVRMTPRYKTKTMRELSELNVPSGERLSVTTLNNRAGKIGGYLLWARERGYPVKDGLEKIMKYKKQQKKRVSDARAIFTSEDLTLLFKPENYVHRVDNRSSRFWIPIIALCTGMRIEEICQLHMEDVREVNSVVCFDVNGKDGKSCKTLAAERLVPIAPTLKELGLMKYVQYRRDRGDKRLFPDLVKAEKTQKYSHAISKWFNRYIKIVGIEEGDRGGKKVFHSFRHTFANQCKQKELNIRFTKQVLGHEQGKDITLDHYAKDYDIDIIYRELMCHVAPQVDLSPLKKVANRFIR